MSQPAAGTPRVLGLTLLPDALAVCRLPAGAETPAWLDGEPFASVTRTPEETSVVCRAEVVPQGVRAELGWCALRVAGPLDDALAALGAAGHRIPRLDVDAG